MDVSARANKGLLRNRARISKSLERQAPSKCSRLDCNKQLRSPLYWKALLLDRIGGGSEHYPSLTEREFAEACQALERKCHDNLDGTNWLSVRWHDDELEIKQIRSNVMLNQSSAVNGASEDEAFSEERVENSHEDEDVMTGHQPVTGGQERPAVDFSILLSPTYRVPILWFTLSSTRVAHIQDLEEIYSRVVVAGSHEALRGIGIMGGISLANHPVTDRPTFFIHPCNTPEAMVALNNGSDLDPFRYLLLWFGVVGSGVGLHIPSRVAL